MSFSPYLLLTAWISLLGIFAYFERLQSKRSSVLADLFLASSLVFFAGMRGASLDYDEYVIMLESVAEAGEMPFLERVLIGKDVLFGSLLILIADFGLGPLAVFFTSAVLSVGLKMAAFRKAFGSGTLGLIVVFATSYFLHDFTQIRAAIAIAFCFCALVALLSGQRIAYILLSLAGIGFHAQVGLFAACTAPLLYSGKFRFVFMAIVSLVFVAIAPYLLNLVSSYDNRPGIAEGVEAISSNGLIAAFINVGLLSSVFLLCKHYKGRMDRDLSISSIILVWAGLFFLLFTFSASVTLAWRVAEMFISFGVFVVVSAIRGTPRPFVLILSIGYCLFNLILLARGPLLVDYRFSESLETYVVSGY